MSHAGDVTPQEAYAALRDDPTSVLVDVRTHAEWSYVGLPVLDGIDKAVVPIEWVRYPDGARNPRFLDELREAGVEEGTPVYFLCRSGARSAAAAEAATAAGLGPAFNVLEGFEGEHDANGHRTVGGWKNSDLPWRQ